MEDALEEVLLSLFLLLALIFPNFSGDDAGSIMKWNEAESLAFLASRTPDWQGKLSYKPPKQSKYLFYKLTKSPRL